MDLHFALARGNAQVAPLEMTKWFDTNYHHLVPEIGPDTPISFADRTIVERFLAANEEGTVVRPVLVGPVTFLAVAKADEATPDYDPFERLDDVVAAYADVLAELAEAGAPWVQIDEHALASDNLHVDRATLIEYSTRVFRALAALEKRPALFAAIGYGDCSRAAASLASTGIEALGLDLRDSMTRRHFTPHPWPLPLLLRFSMSRTTPRSKSGTILCSTRTSTHGWPSLTRRLPRS